MKLVEWRPARASWWDSLTEGWQHLRESASSALTRFGPERHDSLPSSDQVDSAFYMPSLGWSMLGADVFEDDRQLIVRLEVPGMEKADLDVTVQDGVLIVSGEKRFERTGTEGHYRVLQCAYGHFHRSVPLPVSVRGNAARATYKNGVLRVELPKADHAAPRRLNVQVA